LRASISHFSPFHIFLDKKFTFFSTNAEHGLKIGTSHIESRNVAGANL